MNWNFRRVAIVLISCLFAASSWSDEPAKPANRVTVGAVASTQGVVHQRSDAMDESADAATTASTVQRPQRQPPGGIEVLRVYSERDAGTPDETKAGS